MKYLIGVLATIAVLVVIGLALVVIGTYNVAATQPHSRIGLWLLDTTMHSSVEARAGQVDPPPELTDRQLRRGLQHFRDTCEHCHGAPGVEPADWAHGLRPTPPDLAKKAPEWTDQQIFWIVQHGIKMTGMPAFGSQHSDEELWSIVAFVKSLPELSSEEYRDLRRVQEADRGQY